ncbi:MAG: dUTP diphosphatase [Beijerinckiaceae bacterium]|nr:dUTP diphosphatase [Beijerinckiaceae bacterium]
MSLVVPLKILPHGAGLDLPSKGTAGAAGFDLRAAVTEGISLVIEPGGRDLIPTGLSIAIPGGHEGQVRPRSGLALRFGVTVLNAPGTIDCDYRGEIGVILINHGAEPFIIRRGDRIAQLVIAAVAECAFEPVAELTVSERGSGGFGSTGVGKEGPSS